MVQSQFHAKTIIASSEHDEFKWTGYTIIITVNMYKSVTIQNTMIQ